MRVDKQKEINKVLETLFTKDVRYEIKLAHNGVYGVYKCVVEHIIEITIKIINNFYEVYRSNELILSLTQTYKKDFVITSSSIGLLQLYRDYITLATITKCKETARRQDEK